MQVLSTGSVVSAGTSMPDADAHVFLRCALFLVLHEPVIAIHCYDRALAVSKPAAAESA